MSLRTSLFDEIVKLHDLLIEATALSREATDAITSDEQRMKTAFYNIQSFYTRLANPGPSRCEEPEVDPYLQTR